VHVLPPSWGTLRPLPWQRLRHRSDRISVVCESMPFSPLAKIRPVDLGKSAVASVPRKLNLSRLCTQLVLLQNPNDLLLGKSITLHPLTLPKGPDSSSTWINLRGQGHSKHWISGGSRQDPAQAPLAPPRLVVGIRHRRRSPAIKSVLVRCIFPV
jgi:hypothetical protein